MRVLHIITACPYDDEEGDVLTPWLWRVLEELGNRGVKVDLLCPTYKGKRGEYFRGFYVHRYRYCISKWEILGYKTAIPEILKTNKLAYALIPFYILSGLLKSFILSGTENYDVVHVHWPFPLAVPSLPFKMRGIPVVHSYYTAEIKLIENLGPLGKFLRLLSHTADVKTAISTYVKDLLGYEDVIIIPYAAALDIREFHPPKEKPEKPVILFVGRLVERKGVRYLIEATKILRGKGVNASLHIVGDGPLRKELEELSKGLGLEDVVLFKGKIGSQELINEYENSNIFVLPSIIDSRGDTEGLGVVLIEALTFGLPVIASRVGGIPDIIIDKETGLLVNEKDPVSLASAIEYLLLNWEEAKKMVIMGQRRIKDKFSPEIIADKILEIYRGLKS
ncbi:MAG: glycosyltransferase family 4 protein [candidate division WOR-3 bacterium]